MSNFEDMKWNKLFYSLIGKKDEFAVLKNICDQFSKEFQYKLTNYCMLNGIDLAKFYHDLKVEKTNTSNSKPNTNNEEHKEFSKLFRKIALHIHPDRVMNLPETEQNERMEDFNLAKTNLDKGEYVVLFQIAKKYKVPIEKDYKKHSKWMKNQIELYELLIHEQLQTYGYAYSECETEEEKVLLFEKFINNIVKTPPRVA